MTSSIVDKFNKIYNDTYEDVVKYVVCRCKKIDDVSDIVQNIYLEVLKSLKNKDINKNYIIGISNHKIKDYYRFRYRKKEISIEEPDQNNITLYEKIPSNIDIVNNYITNNDIDKVWAYLNKKSIIISRIFYLYYYMGYKIKEISQILNISEINVKHYLYRTLNELNTYLGGDTNE